MARCPKLNADLPPLFAKQPCFEDEGHEGKCRFHMTREEVDAFFKAIDDINGKEETK